MKLISSNCQSKNFVEFISSRKNRNNNRIWDQPSRLSQKLMNTVPRKLKVFEIRRSSMFWHDHQNIFDNGAHYWDKKPRERNLKKKILTMPRREGSIKKTAWGFLLFNHWSLPLGFQASKPQRSTIITSSLEQNIISELSSVTFWTSFFKTYCVSEAATNMNLDWIESDERLQKLWVWAGL